MTYEASHENLEPGQVIRISPISRNLLGVYLADHLAGATAGAQRATRMADDFTDIPASDKLASLAEQIRDEREQLREIILALGLRQHVYRQALAWVAEYAGRLKGNGRVVSRSPSTLVLETELMRSAVIGKLGLWQTLASNAEALGLDAERFERLADSAKEQSSTLDEVHEYARERAFRRDRDTFEGGDE